MGTMPLELTGGVLPWCPVVAHQSLNDKEGTGTLNGVCLSRVGTISQRPIQRLHDNWRKPEKGR